MIKMQLSDNEVRVVQAMRNGARVNLYHHRCESFEEAVEKVNVMSDVKHIRDFDDGETISVGGKRDDIEIASFINYGDKK